MAHNTKIKNRKIRKSHNYVAIIIICFVVIAAGVCGFLIFCNRNQPEENKVEDNQTTYTASTVTTKERPASDTTSREAEKPSVSQYDGQDANTYDELSGFINYAGVIEDNLSIRATISQTVSGSCEVTLINDAGNKLSFTSAIDNGPSASFCSQDIPIAQVRGSHNWKISIIVRGNDKTGTITGEVSV